MPAGLRRCVLQGLAPRPGRGRAAAAAPRWQAGGRPGPQPGAGRRTLAALRQQTPGTQGPQQCVSRRTFAAFRQQTPGTSSEGTWRYRQQMEASERQVWWIAAGIMAIFAGVFALVPLYKIYCQSTGQGQAQATGHKEGNGDCRATASTAG
ncbi:unnamed protein product [Prorocentrum cordatum]|uniref:Uncharacterized protein n=1 Tax=Prorocentrum cordatum TaxID=2364126 RepID=A0ABN9X0I7_9DINO|nr:unnamed protein product [Polarella glacialis]